LKRKRRSRKTNSLNDGLPSPAGLEAGKSHEPRRRQGRKFRLWVFRLVALTLMPVVVLGLAELGLRIAGYGYRTSFFVKTRIKDQSVFVDNQEFGRRFFPVTMARSPSPLVLAAKKPTNTYRIFMLGESAALGDPEPAFGAGRYLEVLLGERYPGTRFEVVSAAVTAINSHALLPIARECAARQGDLWVIYMGHNEVVGPFGAGTVLGPRTPPLFVIRWTLTLKRLRVGQLLDSLLGRFVRGSSSPKSWQGMQMFLEAQTRPDDPSRKRTPRYFQQNLAEILEVARDSGIKVVLSTVASNLKDCPPFASLHSADLSESQRSSWEGRFKEGVELERSTNWTAALETYRQATMIDAQFAELQYRMGRCHLALTNESEARHCFELARDFDGLSFRADATINASIRGLADRSKSNEILLVDAATALAKASPDGISGSELFFEHVHLNPRGNYLLARAFAEKATALLPAAITNRDQGAWLSAEACDAQLCISPWDRHRLDQNILQRERQAPFTLQLDHANRVRLLSIKLAEHRAAMSHGNRTDANTLPASPHETSGGFLFARQLRKVFGRHRQLCDGGGGMAAGAAASALSLWAWVLPGQSSRACRQIFRSRRVAQKHFAASARRGGGHG
jgi:hypothetical protein